MQTACRGTDGKPLYFEFANMSITSAEQLAQMDGWDDASTGNWCATTDVVAVSYTHLDVYKRQIQQRVL